LTVNPGTLVEDIPTEYRVEISETPLKLKVFSLDGSGRMAIEGTVKNRHGAAQRPVQPHAQAAPGQVHDQDPVRCC